MAVLHLDNVPDDLLRSLEGMARAKDRSVSAEAISILEKAVTQRDDREARQAFLREVERIREQGLWAGPGPSTEEMLREDRNR